ncbi:divalent-cation tolerance protein CutA [Dechloromonas denitrificans]|jgi:periplasmic divalent cation tolerance protein|uniref:divalent-cation tolerance protein CutA n=1 Tax=Dechloromonas denitrificans TaxID=281362 RepID=UPI001CF8CBFD|nr:divalent-cation tolerance protein CutA [Dechloromonas denitrificans]UCV11638.1 divalent-cation tolerance protein CutA [Dechloromonas denitrificans]
MEPLLILTNCPDESVANTIALAVVESGLAACVNILPRVESIYRWQGAVESASEIPLLIKSTAANYAALETTIRQRHPYEVPEIIALPITHGLPAYLNWVSAETLQS